MVLALFDAFSGLGLKPELVIYDGPVTGFAHAMVRVNGKLHDYHGEVQDEPVRVVSKKQLVMIAIEGGQDEDTIYADKERAAEMIEATSN